MKVTTHYFDNGFFPYFYNFSEFYNADLNISNSAACVIYM